ncbi:phage head spike fiber domain-containing protein [Ancylobacter sp. VNQ12]|uniref:phage head spike fiber domain-containing protein n=1 Tax=Ancylobacter sp. VNQ12 TaxID=3400920 RepID=UPI003C054395
MAYADWPAGVPFRPERDNWNGAPGREALATDMQGGDVRQRWQPSDDLATLQWGRGLTAAQMGAWEAFLASIAGGAARFLMPVSLDGQAYELRVVQIKGGKGGLRYAPLGVETLVSLALYVFPAVLTPPVPVITAAGDQVVGTGTSGQTIEIDFGGAATRSVVAAGGVFAVDTPFLADGAYWVRARYAGGHWSIPVLMSMPTPLKTTLRTLLLGSASGLVLDFAGTQGGLILAPAAPASQYLGPAMGATVFSRASTATYFDKDGILRTAAANVPRFDYGPITKALKGLRMEGAGTNLAFGATNNNSETFGGGAGILSYSKSFAAPDGTNNATFVVESTANSEHYVADIAVTAVVGDIYVWSAYVKEAPSGAKRCFYIRTVTAAGANSTFDAGAGSWLGAGAGYVSRGFEQLPNGWWRVWMCVTATAAGSLIARMHLHDGVSSVYTGDGTSGLIVWGRQLEKVTAARGPSSYIPALTGVTTRAAESCSVNMANIASLTECTIALDLATEFVASTTGVLSLQKTGLGSNSVYIYMTPSFLIGFASYREGIPQSGAGFSPVSAVGVRERVAVSAKSGAMRAARNGGAPVGGDSGSGFLFPTLDGATITLGSVAFYGWISGLKYFPTALSDAQLQALTA